MKPISGVLRIADRQISPGWHRLRYWAKRVLTKQRITETAIVTFTVTIIAVVLLHLIGALQDRTITGSLPF